MEKINVKDRLTYLAETFDVFECDGDYYLLYNGNEFGRYGFGAAKLVDL